MNKIYQVALMVICLGSAIGLNAVIPKTVQTEFKMEQAQRSPGPETLRLSTFEYEHGAAELLWLDIVQHVGSVIEEKSTSGLVKIAENAHFTSDLDKRFFNAYYVPAILLSVYGRNGQQSGQLLEKGHKAIPDRWEFPFMLGWNNYFLDQNPRAAAQNWKKASQLDDAPRFLGSLSGRAMAQATSPIEGLRFLAELMKNLPQGPRRQMVIERMKLLRGEIVLNAYDRACDDYYKTHQLWPLSAHILYNFRLELPQPYDAFGEPIYFDTSSGHCISRSKNHKIRDFEALERLKTSTMATPAK